MATRTDKKTFDCVEFKRQAQERMRAEWETRKDEFDSYEDFLEATQPEWAKDFWAKVRAAAQDKE